MFHRRSTYRHTGRSPLRSAMTTGAAGREADLCAMVLGGVTCCEATMTNIAAAAANVTNSRTYQRAAGAMAGSTGHMHFRVTGVDRGARGAMAPRAVRGHCNPAGMVDAGMVIDKAAMAD